MNITGEHRKVRVFVNQYAFVSPLVEMPDAVVSAVEVAGVGDVEVAHEFAQVAERGFNQKMEMVGHQDEAVKPDGIDFHGLRKGIEKILPVCVIFEDFFPFIPTAGDVIECAGVLYAEWAGHCMLYNMAGPILSTLKI